MSFCERLSGTTYDRVHGPGRELGAEQFTQKLGGVAPGDAVSYGKSDHGRLQARAEGSPGRTSPGGSARVSAAHCGREGAEGGS